MVLWSLYFHYPSALDVRFKKVTRIAIKHAKREYLHLEVPSSDEEEGDGLIMLNPKRKLNKADRKMTISMSGMMAQVMSGQEKLGSRIAKFETRFEAKLDKAIQKIEDVLTMKNTGEVAPSVAGVYNVYNVIYLLGYTVN